MRNRLAFFLGASALASPLLAAAPPASVPIPSLIKQVSIPHTSFKLANGLTVLVHEDHKAPVVAVSVWYNVGSKDEPDRKTGFAHLFEHLMFNGSENLPGDYFKYLQQVGATDTNGTTSYDRTNYFETVPTGALERALFMESDRMGHLLGAVTPDVLNNQRSVVQNEKRQNDSHPGGLAQYALFENLFPVGHPYHHTTIGSMADLDAASLEDVKQWFRDKYGPNNAVLVIAGDVTAAQARPLVQKYFGAIPRGTVNHPATAPVPTLAAAKQIALKDQVAATIIQRYWAVPGLLDPQLAAIDVGGSILGGLASSRLDKIMVRDEKIAVAVSAGMSPLQRAGIFGVTVVVKPGTDPTRVSNRLDQLMAEYIAQGPTADEVERAVMSEVAGRIRSLEQVGDFGGKANSLAEGQTFARDSNFYRKTLASYASITPAAVRTAMQRWLRRPPLTITLSPGQRDAYSDAKAVPVAAAKPAQAEVAAKPTRIPPPLGQLSALKWPTIAHATLANGIPIVYAQRTTVPLTQLALSFDAGSAADPVNQRGLAGVTSGMLDEGTAKYSSQQLAEAEERLGAEISSSASADRTTVTLSSLSPNLPQSLDLLAEITERPAFNPPDLDRVRAQALTGLAQMMKDPQRVGQRVLPAAIFGAAHPYGAAPGGDLQALTTMTRDDLVSFQHRWLRPDNLKIFVVSDRPLAEVKAALESRFGTWALPAEAKGVKAFSTPTPRPSAAKILLIDRPGAPQSTIIGGQILPVDPRGDSVPLFTANQVLGGDFLSRLNMDLRETKGWSYGVGGNANLLANAVSYTVAAPVQADRTGESLAALNADIGDFLSTKGVTTDELQGNVANLVNALPGEFETSAALLQAMMRNDLLGRPDTYYEGLPARYHAQTIASLDAAARQAIDPKGFVWVVVGDAKKVRPQLDKLGLPIEVVDPK